MQMDSIALTGIRTAATAALTAQYGARRNSTCAAIIGCGAQAKYQLDAMRSHFALKAVRVFDMDAARVKCLPLHTRHPNAPSHVRRALARRSQASASASHAPRPTCRSLQMIWT